VRIVFTIEEGRRYHLVLNVPCGNTSVVTMMIAEKAAATI